MWEITSIGDMSAARMTIPGAWSADDEGLLDLRRDLTTSLTPRLRDLFFAATRFVSAAREIYIEQPCASY